MARRRGKQQIQFPVASADDLDEWVEKSDNILVVLDLHKDWCGPCVVMGPTLEMLTLELEKWEKRVKFLTMDDSLLSDVQKEQFPTQDGCKPAFAVIKHKVIIGKLSGANPPELLTLIRENVFPEPKD